MNSTYINGASASGNGGRIVSWYDLQNMNPKNPLDLICYARLGVSLSTGTEGRLTNSTVFANSPVSSPISILAGSIPTCYANGTDNKQKVEEAVQWNMAHLTRYITEGTLPPSLGRLLFLRGGLEWNMAISLDFGETTYEALELSFLMNASTRGDDQGTIPVISFAGEYTGTKYLVITLKEFGHMRMGLRTLNGGNSAMFEMDWIIVP
jgi:hypothetical protein